MDIPMKNHSRIKFNPMTREIEIEGSEAFVRAYFSKIQKVFSGSPGKARKKRKQTKSAGAAPRKKALKALKKARPRPITPAKETPGKTSVNTRKVTNVSAIVRLIQASADGISAAALKEKTGLSERQIGSIADRAVKDGKIRMMQQGLYGGIPEASEHETE